MTVPSVIVDGARLLLRAWINPKPALASPPDPPSAPDPPDALTSSVVMPVTLIVPP